MPTVDRKLKVFLCHAKEDKPTVRDLHRQLTSEGWMDVWLDEIKLLPGQEWDIEIEKAVEQADVVIVCLSNKSVDKEGYVQKELRFVLNIADEKPEGAIFVIPLRLDDCQVPRRLRAWQYVDYFPKNNQAWAYQRLLQSLKLRAGKIGVTVEDEQIKAEWEQKAKEERERIVLQKTEAERIAREKADAERKAKSERDRIRQQKAEERKKVLAETISKINYKPILTVGGIIIVVFVLFLIGKSISNNLPTSPSPTETLTISTVTVTSQVTVTLPAEVTPTETRIPPTNTPELPTITSTPTLGIGSTMVSEKDGSPMVFVPAGDFTMGSTSQQIVQMVANCNEGANVCNFNNFDKEIPQHEVYLDSYYIDQYEVTNARYAKCVAAGICQPPKDLSSSTYTNYYGNHDFDNYPIIRVNWSDAKIYCGWREDRLPSEAEWEKAARGTDERVYPWGDNIDCSHANYSGCVGETVSVGSYESGKSPYDVYDMAGNVWEWVNDWYGSYQNLHVYNPLGPSSGEDHILRGGSWYHLDVYVRSTWRTRSSGLEHLQSTATVGFRCAKSAP